MKIRGTILIISAGALLALPSFGFANATVYGSIRMSLKAVDDGDETVVDLVNNASRVGFKGSTDLGNGLTVVGLYEIGVNADTGVFGAGSGTNRLSYAGFKGNFGELYAGSQWAPYYSMVGGLTDLFGTVGAQHIRKVFRIADTILYKNSFGPVTLAGSLSFDGEAAESAVDRAQLGAQIPFGDFTLALGMENLSQTGETGVVDGNTTGIGGIYKAGSVLMTASYQMVEAAVEGTAEDQKKAEVYFGYDFGPNTLRASYGQTDSGESTPSSISVGYERRLSDDAKVWIEGQYDNTDSKVVEDKSALGVGMRYDW